MPTGGCLKVEVNLSVTRYVLEPMCSRSRGCSGEPPEQEPGRPDPPLPASHRASQGMLTSLNNHWLLWISTSSYTGVLYIMCNNSLCETLGFLITIFSAFVLLRWTKLPSSCCWWACLICSAANRNCIPNNLFVLPFLSPCWQEKVFSLLLFSQIR